ncbi:MAG: CotH kinase family protein [Lewinellaceae bacterium]|nr:CotH kinase family protein [Lewinellaceae bacterium]
MLRTLLPYFFTALCYFELTAQTFTSVPLSTIYDSTILVSELQVTGLPEEINDCTFGLESVCFSISYSEVRHLIVTLYAPDGTMIKLAHLNGRDEADHFANTCFGEIGKYFPWEHPPYYGGYQPILPLGTINNGQNPNGTWKLVVEEYQGDEHDGLLERWSLTFGKDPADRDAIIDSSHLPILVINTNGRHIPDEPKINAHLGVISHSDTRPNRVSDAFDHYDGQAGIEWRGASSKSFWQQSFSLETRDIYGEDLDFPLLGMPAEADWVLHGPFSDKSLIRNALTFALAQKVSNAYVPRTRFCELVLNGSYIGVYTLIEKIKRGAERLDIAKMKKSDISGDDVTGGYIIKVDRSNAEGWYSPYRPQGGGKVFFNYVYPKPEDLRPEQMAYIQAYVDSFENAMMSPGFADPQTGWRNFADENSFIEHFLMNEVCKNVDAYRLSGYLYKPRDSDGGKLHAGPLWDYNLAWRNANYADNESPSGWTFDSMQRGVPFWWERLLQDSQYTANMRCQWQQLRSGALSQRHIFGVIDSLTSALGGATDRHFELYPILGHGIWPNPKPIAKTHAEEIENMKIWISERLRWLDANVPGNCPDASAEWQAAPWVLYPNPVRDILTVFLETAPAEGSGFLLSDLAGRLVGRKEVGGFRSEWDISYLPQGVYLLYYMNAEGRILNTEKIVKF